MIVEPRRFLTAPDINPQLNPPETITETTSYFQYLSNPGVGTAVYTVSVTGIDGDYNPVIGGGLAITEGNTDVNGNGIAPFRVRPMTNIIELNDPADLNFESATRSFSLTVTATDVGVPPTTSTPATIVINIRPGNDRPVIPEYGWNPVTLPLGTPPTDAWVNVYEVPENSFNGTIDIHDDGGGNIIDHVTAIDDDPGDQELLTYTLVGTIPGFDSARPAFAIDPFTGRI